MWLMISTFVSNPARFSILILLLQLSLGSSISAEETKDGAPPWRNLKNLSVRIHQQSIRNGDPLESEEVGIMTPKTFMLGFSNKSYLLTLVAEAEDGSFVEVKEFFKDPSIEISIYVKFDASAGALPGPVVEAKSQRLSLNVDFPVPGTYRVVDGHLSFKTPGSDATTTIQVNTSEERRGFALFHEESEVKLSSEISGVEKN